jgi:hypothetical protein
VPEHCEVASHKGLQYAGASGLLAVLFPKHFAMADRFVVEALREVESLLEKQRIAAMNAQSLNESDAVLLIDIHEVKDEAAEWMVCRRLLDSAEDRQDSVGRAWRQLLRMKSSRDYTARRTDRSRLISDVRRPCWSKRARASA